MWCVIFDRPRKHCGKIPELIDEAEQALLAHIGFPREHHSENDSANPTERLNGGTKRRADLAGILPNEALILRLVGALLISQNSEWALCSRNMSMEMLAELGDNLADSVRAIAN